eukprot:Skav215399  [mRNA]  locus=scaffold5320:8775:12469:- [translate_table: standard]
MQEGDEPEQLTVGERQLDGSFEECRVIAGPFAIGVQIFLAIVVVCTLLYKRYQEKPQRGLVIWLMDISKQDVDTPNLRANCRADRTHQLRGHLIPAVAAPPSNGKSSAP